jgi:hypothetical protein
MPSHQVSYDLKTLISGRLSTILDGDKTRAIEKRSPLSTRTKLAFWHVAGILITSSIALVEIRKSLDVFRRGDGSLLLLQRLSITGFMSTLPVMACYLFWSALKDRFSMAEQSDWVLW